MELGDSPVPYLVRSVPAGGGRVVIVGESLRAEQAAVRSVLVLLAIFALVAGPSWFARDKHGFAQPAIDSGLLGLFTLLLVPLQILLVAFAMRGFNQGWNVELEQREPGGGEDLYGGAPPYAGAPPQPA